MTTYMAPVNDTCYLYPRRRSTTFVLEMLHYKKWNLTLSILLTRCLHVLGIRKITGKNVTRHLTTRTINYLWLFNS